MEISLEWETKNKYAVFTPSGESLAYIAERSAGLMGFLFRWLMRSHRPFHIDVFSPSGTLLFTFKRKFFWFFSDLNIFDANGKRLGNVYRRFSIFHKVYDLHDEWFKNFARIKSPFWRIWTFSVEDSDAAISKRWGGVLSEIFTDADTFLVDFGSKQWTAAQRLILFAAAISVDFDFFENND